MTDHWTRQLVEQCLIEAMRWLRFVASGEGARGISSGMPKPILTLEERLGEGWDIEMASAEDEVRLNPSRAQIALYEAALMWPADLLAPIDRDVARMVNLYCACRAFGAPFSKEASTRAGMSRPKAYRLRDKGLVWISTILERKGVPVWRTSLEE